MLAKLSPANLMLMKGHVSVKSLAAIAVFTACMPGPSLAAVKWADCTTSYNPKRSIVSSFKVELKTNSDKVSVIRDTVVIQEKLSPQLSSKSAQVQIIAPASWFPTEVLIGPFDGHPSTYTSDSGRVVTSKTPTWLKISRQTLEWDQGITFPGDSADSKNWYGLNGTCRIILNPVKTLF